MVGLYGIDAGRKKRMVGDGPVGGGVGEGKEVGIG